MQDKERGIEKMQISQVNQMINDGEIDLSPDFQRGFVWTDITRKSRLIESLLLRIPVFYFAQDEEGLFQVVEGVQGLTVINSFMKNASYQKLAECFTAGTGIECSPQAGRDKVQVLKETHFTKKTDRKKP